MCFNLKTELFENKFKQILVLEKSKQEFHKTL
jgi:hypothetical protein